MDKNQQYHLQESVYIESLALFQQPAGVPLEFYISNQQDPILHYKKQRAAIVLSKNSMAQCKESSRHSHKQTANNNIQKSDINQRTKMQKTSQNNQHPQKVFIQQNQIQSRLNKIQEQIDDYAKHKIQNLSHSLSASVQKNLKSLQSSKYDGNFYNNKNQQTAFRSSENSLMMNLSKQTDFINSRGSMQQVQRFNERQFWLLQFNQYIFEVADRNDAVQAQFGHFLIPFALVLRMITLQSSTCNYIHQVIRYIYQKLQGKNILKPIKEQVLRDFFLVMENATKSSQILNFLRNFLIQQKQILTNIMPYYYNFFALLVNKQRYFNGNPKEYLDYTIQFQHVQFRNGQFGLNDVKEMISRMEESLNKEYNDESK